MTGRPSTKEKEPITLYEILERSATEAIKLQRDDGSFPPGQNGVYNESETPVRTTSHWLTTLSKVYDITGEKKFEIAALNAADYLLSDAARPLGYTFHSRNVRSKDKCDGLVGQAAPIRGLARSGMALDKSDFIGVAKDVFLLHPFNERLGLWESVEINGYDQSYDRTLNHQIIFAAAGANLASECEEIHRRITIFLDSLDKTMRLRDDGVIRHYARPKLRDIFTGARSARDFQMLILNEVMFHYRSISKREYFKEIGYQPVNLGWLAQLHQLFSEHRLWNCEKIETAVDFVNENASLFLGSESNTEHGSVLPGTQIALALFTIGNESCRSIRHWIEADLEHKYDNDRHLLIRNTPDKFYQASAINFLVDFPDMVIKI